jgi:cytochrome c-type biogenesis protein CcmH/NrfG
VQRPISRGRALFVTRAYEEAISWFNEVLELDPENVDASAVLEEAQEYLRIQSSMPEPPC